MKQSFFLLIKIYPCDYGNDVDLVVRRSIHFRAAARDRLRLHSKLSVLFLHIITLLTSSNGFERLSTCRICSSRPETLIRLQ